MHCIVNPRSSLPLAAISQHEIFKATYYLEMRNQWFCKGTYNGQPKRGARLIWDSTISVGALIRFFICSLQRLISYL